MINIFITNLGKYNEGFLIGEWLSLPADEAALASVLERIGINDEYEEYFITDHETDIDGLEIGEYSSIDTLNSWAKTYDSLQKYEAQALKAFLENGCSFDEAFQNVSNGDYLILSNCSDMTDVAYQVIEESGYLSNVPENVSRYFDYEAFGRDLRFEGTYIFIDKDCVQLLA